MKEIIGMEKNKVNYNKSVKFKILVHIICVIMDKKIAHAIVQYQQNKKIMDMIEHLKNVEL
jgi:uncharacterized membrane protein YidH (DUF202 family)